MFADLIDGFFGLILLVIGLLSAIVGVPVFVAGVKGKADLSMFLGASLIAVSALCAIYLFFK